MNKILPEKGLIIIAFLTIYIVWGSTYIANEYAIDFMPPWLMGGMRFFVAGFVLLVFQYAVGWKKINRQHWFNNICLGVLMLTFGVGGTVWALQFVDSGIAALLVSLEPVIIVLFLWALDQKRPKNRAILGILIGLIGSGILVNQSSILASKNSIVAILAILLCISSWSLGTVFIPRVELSTSKIQNASIQMLGGSMGLFGISFFLQEYKGLHLEQIPWQSWTALAYLIVFGSMLAFTAFNYLLGKVSPDKVATATYVNPVIAILLGWFFRNELITTQTLFATVILLSGVYFINSSK